MPKHERGFVSTNRRNLYTRRTRRYTGIEIHDEDHGKVEAFARVNGQEAYGIFFLGKHRIFAIIGIFAHAPIEPPDEPRERPAPPSRHTKQTIHVANTHFWTRHGGKDAIQIERRHRGANGFPGMKTHGCTAQFDEPTHEILETRAIRRPQMGPSWMRWQ